MVWFVSVCCVLIVNQYIILNLFVYLFPCLDMCVRATCCQLGFGASGVQWQMKVQGKDKVKLAVDA